MPKTLVFWRGGWNGLLVCVSEERTISNSTMFKVYIFYDLESLFKVYRELRNLKRYLKFRENLLVTPPCVSATSHL